MGYGELKARLRDRAFISKWESLQVLEQESDKLGPHALTLRLSADDGV